MLVITVVIMMHILILGLIVVLIMVVMSLFWYLLCALAIAMNIVCLVVMISGNYRIQSILIRMIFMVMWVLMVRLIRGQIGGRDEGPHGRLQRLALLDDFTWKGGQPADYLVMMKCPRC